MYTSDVMYVCVCVRERERVQGIHLSERPIHSIESVWEVNELTTCRSHMKVYYKSAW